jgi:general secretion pathway protein H
VAKEKIKTSTTGNPRLSPEAGFKGGWVVANYLIKGPGLHPLALRPSGLVVDRAATRTQGGFTLLELMAVLALMTLLMGLVLPSLLRNWEREKSRATLRELASVLRTARSEAVVRSQRIRLFLNLKTGRYWLEGSERVRGLTGLTLVDARLVWQNPEKRQGYIAFYGDGSSSGGKLVLVETTGRRHLLEVKPITGKVSLGLIGQ